MLKTESINTYVLCVIQCSFPPTFLDQPVFVDFRWTSVTSGLSSTGCEKEKKIADGGTQPLL